MGSANYTQKQEDMPVSFKSAVWENFGFQVNCVSDGIGLDEDSASALLNSCRVWEGKRKHAGHGLHFIASRLC